VVLPQQAQYWAAGANRKVVAKVKATAPGPYDLTTYDVTADDCIQQHQGEACCGGNSCDSGNVCQSGTCKTCGGLNQPCGGGGGCSSGLACSSGICQVPPCGGANQACCAGSTCPGSTNAQPLTCDTDINKCTPCGHLHQDCCFPNSNPPFGCDGNLSCMNEPGGYQCECDINVFPNGCF
jgi:hypothetical protein